MWKQAQYLQMKDNSVLSLQKYRSQGVRMKKKKDQGAWTRSPVLSDCLAPAAADDNDDNNNKIKKKEYIWTIPSAQWW